MNFELFCFRFTLHFLFQSFHHKVHIIREVFRTAELILGVAIQFEHFLASARINPFNGHGSVAYHLVVFYCRPQFRLFKLQFQKSILPINNNLFKLLDLSPLITLVAANMTVAAAHCASLMKRNYVNYSRTNCF